MRGENLRHRARILQGQGEVIEGEYIVQCKAKVSSRACHGLARAFADTQDGASVTHEYTIINGFALSGIRESVSERQRAVAVLRNDDS